MTGIVSLVSDILALFESRDVFGDPRHLSDSICARVSFGSCESS